MYSCSGALGGAGVFEEVLEGAAAYFEVEVVVGAGVVVVVEDEAVVGIGLILTIGIIFLLGKLILLLLFLVLLLILGVSNSCLLLCS